MSVQTNNTQKLEALFSPHRVDIDVLKEAFAEVAKEDSEKRKIEAKDLIRKARELQNRMNVAERQFNSDKKKFDKELGKIINKLTNMAAGRQVDDEEEEKEKEGNES